MANNELDFATLAALARALGGSADPAVIEAAVSDWLDQHPEATTTVEDGSITKAKLDSNLAGAIDDVGDLKTAMNAVENAIDDLEDAIVNKANVDGSYPSMTVGNAEQLVATIGVEDAVPYNFRTAGGSADIGDREVDKIVGGTLAWNQRVPVLTQRSTTANGLTFTVDANNKLTVSGTATARSSYEMMSVSKSAGTLTMNHIYYLRGCPSGGGNYTFYAGVAGIVCDTGNGGLFKYNYTQFDASAFRIDYYEGATINGSVQIQYIDLTQMFGSTIADYIYSLEQATAGAGVAWFRKLFPKPYYAYNAGELMSVQTSAHKMVGFNQFDANANYYLSPYLYVDVPIGATNKLYMSFIDKNPSIDVTGINVGFTDINQSGTNRSYRWVMENGVINSNRTNIANNGPAIGAFCPYVFVYPYTDEAWNTLTSRYDICVNLSWDGERDGEYEPYQAWEYPLDSDLTLRGIPKLDADNNLYYDGDTYESDGTVTRRYGVVDLGTLDWKVSVGGSNTAYTVGDTLPALYDSASPRWICNAYKSVAFSTASSLGDMYVWIDSSYRVRVKDTSKNELTDAAFKAAMSGVYLVYELATPTTEEADPYQNPQIVEDFGTEEYIDTRDVPIPVGHDTTYRANLRAKLEMSPNSPDGDGDYIVRQANGQNEYVLLTKELPAVPSSDGNYILKCTVASGAATYTWEAQT